MKQFRVTYRPQGQLTGRQQVAVVAAFDEAGARVRFRHEHPGASIIGVRPAGPIRR